MNVVTILRDLWRMRRAVGCVVVVAVFAGLFLAYRPSFPPKSRKYQVGVASVRVLVDTPDSQVIAVSPKGSDTLSVRANLLASLVVDGVIKATIAKHAGVPADKIAGLTASSTSGPPATTPSAHGYVLTTNVLTDTEGTQLPIIEIDAQAPDATAAARLANASVDGLRSYLDSQAAIERIPDVNRLRVDGLGPAQGHEVTRGSRDLLSAVLVVFIIVMGCAALLLIPALAREWRAASEDEAAGVLSFRDRQPVVLDFDEDFSNVDEDDLAVPADDDVAVWAEVELAEAEDELTTSVDGDPGGLPDDDLADASPGASVSELPPRKRAAGGRGSGGRSARARRS